MLKTFKNWHERHAAASPAAPEGETPRNERVALEWLVNLGHGVGKAGGPPEPGEFEDAMQLAEAALAPPPAPPAPALDHFDSSGRHTDVDAARGDAHPVGCYCTFCNPSSSGPPAPVEMPEALPCLVESDACGRCGKVHPWDGCRVEFPVDPDAWCDNCKANARRRPDGETR